MFERLRACDPTQSLARIIFYRICRFPCVILARVMFGLRVMGLEHVPREGGVLVVPNHQSHLDPPLIGVAIGMPPCRRNMAPIARSGLFRVPVLGLVLRWLGCISIRQDEGDAGAIRASIAELKRGRLLLMFPEGSRSPDGAMHSFKRGAWLLMGRSGCDVVPAAVEGAFDAWPRARRLPRLLGGPCWVKFGAPVPSSELKRLGADAGLELLASHIDAMRLELRAGLRARSDGKHPSPGPGDQPRLADEPTMAEA